MSTNEIKHVPKGWGYEKWIVNTDLTVVNFCILMREKDVLGIIIIRKMKLFIYKVEKFC